MFVPGYTGTVRNDVVGAPYYSSGGMPLSYQPSNFLPGDERHAPQSTTSRPITDTVWSERRTPQSTTSRPIEALQYPWSMRGAPSSIQGRPTALPMPFQRPSSPMQTFAQPVVQPQQVMPGFGQRPQISNYNPNLAPGAQNYRPNGLGPQSGGYNPWVSSGSPVGTISVVGGNRGLGGGATIGGDAGPAGQSMRGLGQGWGGQSTFFGGGSTMGGLGQGWAGQSNFFR